jgi:hypothetical protein
MSKDKMPYQEQYKNPLVNYRISSIIDKWLR